MSQTIEDLILNSVSIKQHYDNLMKSELSKNQWKQFENFQTIFNRFRQNYFGLTNSEFNSFVAYTQCYQDKDETLLRAEIKLYSTLLHSIQNFFNIPISSLHEETNDDKFNTLLFTLKPNDPILIDIFLFAILIDNNFIGRPKICKIEFPKYDLNTHSVFSPLVLTKLFWVCYKHKIPRSTFYFAQKAIMRGDNEYLYFQIIEAEAQNNDRNAMHYLAVWYLQSGGSDMISAFYYFRRAAELKCLNSIRFYSAYQQYPHYDMVGIPYGDWNKKFHKYCSPQIKNEIKTLYLVNNRLHLFDDKNLLIIICEHICGKDRRPIWC